MKKAKTSSQNENLTDILKLLTKRIEESTVDIHRMKLDVGMISLKFRGIETNIGIIKSDIEKLRDELSETESRLNKRITIVGDLITVELGKKIQAHAKRLSRLETTASAN